MMTLRQQVRTVKPYRTENSRIKWEQACVPNFGTDMRKRYGRLGSDEQIDPYDEVGTYIKTMYYWDFLDKKLQISKRIVK